MQPSGFVLSGDDSSNEPGKQLLKTETTETTEHIIKSRFVDFKLELTPFRHMLKANV
jgi:hypothetical protein